MLDKNIHFDLKLKNHILILKSVVKSQKVISLLCPVPPVSERLWAQKPSGGHSLYRPMALNLQSNSYYAFLYNYMANGVNW